jgi:peptidylprolyl isomerase
MKCLAALLLMAALSSTQESPDKSTDKSKSDFITTPSGLQYQDIRKGVGSSPHMGETVRVHYTGWLTDGKIFDSSVNGRPREFVLDPKALIKGWVEGLLTMKVDGKRRLIVPPDLAYGAKGHKPVPPNATLIFDIELLGIK